MGKIAVLLCILVAVCLTACTDNEPPVEVTRIVEVPGQEVVVTRIVEIPDQEVEATRVVEVIAEPEPEMTGIDDEDYPEATLPGTEVRILSSEHTGREYKISVALPQSYDTGISDYPVLYVLDANQVFGLVTEFSRSLTLRDGLAETVLVGIGYETDDFTEIVEMHKVNFVLEDAEFLQFIQEELRPLINDEYRVDPDEAAIFGHSLPGLFVLYTLFQEPQVFSGYIIGSPPMVGDNFDDEAAYAENHSDLVANVFMGVGTEHDVDSRNLENFTGILEERGYDNLEITNMVFEGETHISVIPDIVNHGMQTVFD